MVNIPMYFFMLTFLVMQYFPYIGLLQVGDRRTAPKPSIRVLSEAEVMAGGMGDGGVTLNL